MSLQNPYILGAFMIAAGLFLWLAARLVLNRLILEKPAAKTAVDDAAGETLPQVEALLLVRQGGRLAWLNLRAMEIFKLTPGDVPNLEQLARKTRSPEDFLRLCARDGQGRLILNGMTLEVKAHTLCVQDEIYRLVALSEVDLGSTLTAGVEHSLQSSALQDLSNMTRSLSASLDLKASLKAIWGSIHTLIPLDALDICLWDSSSERSTAYQMRADNNGEVMLEKQLVLSDPFPNLAGRGVDEGKAWLLKDKKACQKVQPIFEPFALKIKACMGAPLLVGDELVGTLAIGNCEEGRYQEHDLELLKWISNHAAVALRNAQLYEQERRRSAELNGLAQLTQAFGSIRDPHRLFAHLVECISPLIPVNILGFLIYNENTRMLEGRAPINGLPDEFVEMYRIPIPGSSPLEQIYLAQEMICSQNAAEDVHWGELGLHPLAAAASLRETVLMPLVSGGKMLGYLQAANHAEGSVGYTEDEFHLLRILASQAAPIIENASMLHQLSLRAQRAETLRQISSLATSTAPLDEILRTSMEQLAHLLRADYAAVFIIDKSRTSLRLQRSASFGDYTDIPEELTCLQMTDAQYPFTAAGSLHTIYSSKGRPEKPLVPFYCKLMSALQVESLAAAPLVARGEGIAEIWVGKRGAEFFETGDLQVIGSAAGLLAGLVENALEDRTEELNREHHRLETMLRVSNELSASLDIQQVLQRSLAVVNEALGAQQSMILTSTNSEVFRAGALPASLSEYQKVADDTLERQIDRWVTQTRSPLQVDHLAEDKRWSLPADRPVTANSLLGMPLILGEEVLGSLLLFHAEAAFFQDAQIDLLEAIARQIAGALKNNELFNLIRDQAEKLGVMLREQQIEASRSRAILEAVADGVVVTGAGGQITLFNESAKQILGASMSELADKGLEELGSLVGKAGEEWLKTIRSWTSEHSNVHDGHTYAAQINLDNGRVVSIHLAPVIWRTSFLGTVSIFHDITHQAQVDRLKTEFVTNVSHELRTPLTSIKGYADILLMGAAGQLSDQQNHFINVIHENALRLQGLVDNLLDVSHIQAGQVALEYQEIDLEDLAKSVAADLRELAIQENKPITVSLEIQAGLPCVHGDLARTRQVLRSLAMNGYDYTPENGEVFVRIYKSGEEELQVDVKDNGIGIPFEDQPRIFDRFFRGEHPLIMATAGAGLGLALSKILIEMQGGRIWFTSSGVPGEGSVFSFTIPVERKEG